MHGPGLLVSTCTRTRISGIVSLVENEDGAPVALIAAPNKSHELPSAQKLFRSEAVTLVGCVPTADPLGRLTAFGAA